MVEGKVTLENLSFLLSRLGIKNPGIIVPPLIGSDATAFDFDMAKQVALDYYGLQEECYMVWKSDPITFPAPDLSKYSIIVNLNDLTCFGAIPYGILVTLLLPTHFNQSDLQNFQNSLHETALDYNISILGGHSEFTSAVIRPVIDLSMIGFVPKTFLPTRNLAAGDHVYLLGYVGNEGTAILGEKIKKIEVLPKRIKTNLEKLQIFEDSLSVFKDGLKINKSHNPKLMHDPTEGGLLGALYEMMVSSNLGVEISSELVKNHIHPLTEEISHYLNINPLRLISSGTLLICSERKISFKNLKLHHKISKIGIITKNKSFIFGNQEFGPPEPDEIIKGFEMIDKLFN